MYICWSDSIEYWRRPSIDLWSFLCSVLFCLIICVEPSWPPRPHTVSFTQGERGFACSAVASTPSQDSKWATSELTLFVLHLSEIIFFFRCLLLNNSNFRYFAHFLSCRQKTKYGAFYNVLIGSRSLLCLYSFSCLKINIVKENIWTL